MAFNLNENTIQKKIMKDKKLFVLAAALIVAVSLVTTSCNFGKDDFYGTWNSGDFEYNGDTLNVTFYFSGTSESLLGKGKAFFYEHYVRTGSSPIKTFWWGQYGTDDNSNVTSGNLTLKYYYGYNMTTNEDNKTLDELIALATGDDPVTAFDDGKGVGCVSSVSGVFDFYDQGNELCSDVEKFNYELSDQDFFKGYQGLTAVADCEWTEMGSTVTNATQFTDTDGYTKSSPRDGTSWGDKGNSRSFTLIHAH